MIQNTPVPIFKTIQRYRQDQDQIRMSLKRQAFHVCDPNSADSPAEFFFAFCRQTKRRKSEPNVSPGEYPLKVETKRTSQLKQAVRPLQGNNTKIAGGDDGETGNSPDSG